MKKEIVYMNLPAQEFQHHGLVTRSSMIRLLSGYIIVRKEFERNGL
jgi:hypothetical protein